MPRTVASIWKPPVLTPRPLWQHEPSLTNVEFRVGDIYALDLDDDSVDVVHAHQVLQHLSDPVAALREMARVVPARRDRRRARRRLRRHGLGAGRRHGWTAGSTSTARCATATTPSPTPDVTSCGGRPRPGSMHVEPSASVWCFATPETRRWWGSLWADRSRQSAFATQALDRGLTTPDELEEIAAGWHRWADDPTSWFTVVSGELLCTVA